jgi:hypothetical protein
MDKPAAMRACLDNTSFPKSGKLGVKVALNIGPACCTLRTRNYPLEIAMENLVKCTLSADALSEIRRKVNNSRKDTSVSSKSAAAHEIVSHDMRVITAFLTEDFEASVTTFFTSRVQPEPWPEINSWDYPGPWVNAVTEEISSILEDREFSNIFSKSGLYSLRIAKIS